MTYACTGSCTECRADVCALDAEHQGDHFCITHRPALAELLDFGGVQWPVTVSRDIEPGVVWIGRTGAKINIANGGQLTPGGLYEAGFEPHVISGWSSGAGAWGADNG